MTGVFWESYRDREMLRSSSHELHSLPTQIRAQRQQIHNNRESTLTYYATRIFQSDTIQRKGKSTSISQLAPPLIHTNQPYSQRMSPNIVIFVVIIVFIGILFIIWWFYRRWAKEIMQYMLEKRANTRNGNDGIGVTRDRGLRLPSTERPRPSGCRYGYGYGERRGRRSGNEVEYVTRHPRVRRSKRYPSKSSRAGSQRTWAGGGGGGGGRNSRNSHVQENNNDNDRNNHNHNHNSNSNSNNRAAPQSNTVANDWGNEDWGNANANDDSNNKPPPSQQGNDEVHDTWVNHENAAGFETNNANEDTGDTGGGWTANGAANFSDNGGVAPDDGGGSDAGGPVPGALW